VLPIHVPPLRERASDLATLIPALSKRLGASLSWTDAAIKRLQAHPWPGNVRELENTIERLGILCEGGRPVTLERVEQALGDSASALPSRRETFIDEERDRYERLLNDNRWNVSAVARQLNLSRGALRHRLRKHGLL
jgi:two-component system NtrC family response regulator